MNILWINPVGTEVFDADTQKILDKARSSGTRVDGGTSIFT